MKYLVVLLTASITLFASPIDSYLEQLKKEATIKNQNFKGFDVNRGKKIFTSKHIGKRGKKVSCASCHISNLSNYGENVFTGKKIKPLSPKANPKRLTDIKKVKKWLRRNFKDVYKREGTPQEKGDVLLYILNN